MFLPNVYLHVQVWPQGKTVFPDFFLPQTADVWEQLIVKHFETIRFDGLWIVSGTSFFKRSLRSEPHPLGLWDERQEMISVYRSRAMKLLFVNKMVRPA